MLHNGSLFGLILKHLFGLFKHLQIQGLRIAPKNFSDTPLFHGLLPLHLLLFVDHFLLQGVHVVILLAA